MTLLSLASITTTGGAQPRAAIDPTVVADYAERMLAGDPFPPVVVFYDGSQHWLADGYHRLQAARKAGLPEIAVDLRQGDQRAAQWHSYSVNGTHGLRRTQEDKRRQILGALSHPAGASMSDYQIAEHVGVHRMTVAKYRSEVDPHRDSELSSLNQLDRTVQRGNSTYVMQTAAIGRIPVGAGLAPAPLPPDQLAPASPGALSAAIRAGLDLICPANPIGQRRILDHISWRTPAGAAHLDSIASHVRSATGQIIGFGAIHAACQALRSAWHADATPDPVGADPRVRPPLGDRPLDAPALLPAAQPGLRTAEAAVRAWLAAKVAPDAQREVLYSIWCNPIDESNHHWIALCAWPGLHFDGAMSDLLEAVKAIWQERMLDPLPVPPTPDPAADLASMAQLVGSWLDSLVETGDLADDRDGRRLTLVSVLQRRDGYARRLSDYLIRHNPDAFPAGAPIIPQDQLAPAVRQALRNLGIDVDAVGAGLAPALTPAPRPGLHLIAYKAGQQRAGGTARSPYTDPARLAAARGRLLQQMRATVDRALGDLIAYAGRLEEPDLQLAEIIERLQNAVDLARESDS